MQENIKTRSNKARTDATRSALIKAARALFVKKGYTDTGTPEIVKAAKVTRGALYHHFKDKMDLFRAVILEEAQAVANHIKSDAEETTSAVEALLAGMDGYFESMSKPGRIRLLLIDGPSVLGPLEMEAVDRQAGGNELLIGLEAAIPEEKRGSFSLEIVADLLSAAFDKAALAVSQGKSREDYKNAMRPILEALAGQ